MIRTITSLVVVIVLAVVPAAQDPPQTAIPNVISAGLGVARGHERNERFPSRRDLPIAQNKSDRRSLCHGRLLAYG
jgi:hypothetical protein